MTASRAELVSRRAPAETDSVPWQEPCSAFLCHRRASDRFRRLISLCLPEAHSALLFVTHWNQTNIVHYDLRILFRGDFTFGRRYYVLV